MHLIMTNIGSKHIYILHVLISYIIRYYFTKVR